MPRCLSLLTLLLLTACALGPEPRNGSASGNVPDWPELSIPYEEFRLDNGLRLIVHEDRRAPLVAVNVWYHVGSKNEPAGRTGFAHLFEHLMFNGSEHYDDEFFRPLEEVGATGMNGTTNPDRTNYFATVPRPALDRLLWLESDRMGHLLGAVTQDKLDEQRGVVQNEKRQRENEPYGEVWNILPGFTYPAGHPYSWTTIGSMADLDAAELADVEDWFRTWYGAANATIVIAGDVSAEHALERVRHYFGHIPAGPDLQRPQRWIAPIPDQRRATLHDDVPQARVYRVYNVAENYTADAIHLQLAAEILGGGKGSRLYERLVHGEQLATGVQAALAPGEIGSQLYLIATVREGVEPARVEAILDAELDRLRREGPTAAELNRVRSGLYAAVARGLERIGGFGGKSDQLAAAAVLAGDPGMWDTDLRWLREAGTEDLRAALRQWTSGGHATLTVLPDTPKSVQADAVDRSGLPAVDSAPELDFPDWQSTTLDNGLRVVVAQRPDSPVSEYRWFRRGGFARDPQGQEGLGVLTMDLLDESAGGRDPLELARALESQGARLSSGAGLDWFGVALSAIRGLEAQALDIFADVLTDPRFKAEDFERRKALMRARIQQEQASPFSLGLRALPPLLYGAEHPYGKPLTGSGTLASLDPLQLDDVQAHAARHLQPQGATLLIVGALSLDEAIAQLPPALRGWQGDGGLPLAELPPAERSPGGRIFLIDRPDAPQSVILAGQLVATDAMPENLALETANALFGGLFTSRLNMNLREDKGWAYGAGSALVDTRAQRPWLVYSRVESARTADAMREVRRELRALREPGAISAEELRHATRNRALKLPGQHETAGQLVGSISTLLKRDWPADHYETLPGRLLALQPEQVADAARAHLEPQALDWVIVGDVARIRAQIEALGWAAPQQLDRTP